MQYGWYFDISKKVKKSIFQNRKIFYVHSWDILCTLFSSILEDATERNFFNSIFYVQVECYVYIYIYNGDIMGIYHIYITIIWYLYFYDLMLTLLWICLVSNGQWQVYLTNKQWRFKHWYYGVARSIGVTSNDTEMMINRWTGRGILVVSDKLILKWFCSFSSAQKTPQTFKCYAETKCFLRVMLWCNGHSLSKPSRKRQLKCLAQKLPSLSWSQPALWL